MNVLLLNPNTSADMTAHIQREAARHTWPGVSLLVATARFGGAVIASRASYAIAAHAALDAYAAATATASGSGSGSGSAAGPAGLDGRVAAVVLACFGDPGLEALREVSGIPVLGLLESAVAQAARAGEPFGIVTAGPAWVPMLEERIRSGPHAALSRGVFAIRTTGLDVARDPDRFVSVLQAAVDEAAAAGARNIILGGSALAGFGSRLSGAVRLIDPLEAAMADAQRCLAGADASAPFAGAPNVPPIAYQGLSPALEATLARPSAVG